MVSRDSQFLIPVEPQALTKRFPVSLGSGFGFLVFQFLGFPMVSGLFGVSVAFVTDSTFTQPTHSPR